MTGFFASVHGRTRPKKNKGKMGKKKLRRHPCCTRPAGEHHNSWQDETGNCKNCGKPLRHGNGPLPYGAWS